MKVVQKEIDVLAYNYKEKNYPVPIKIRMTKDTGDYIVVNIDRLISHHMEKKAGNLMDVYLCQSFNYIENGFISFEIKYDKQSGKWILYKI